MPKLRLFYGTDPLESDTIPFPRSSEDQFELRLAADEELDAVKLAEQALDDAQRQMDAAQSFVNSDWWSPDDPPRAA